MTPNIMCRMLTSKHCRFSTKAASTTTGYGKAFFVTGKGFLLGWNNNFPSDAVAANRLLAPGALYLDTNAGKACVNTDTTGAWGATGPTVSALGYIQPTP